MKLEHGSFADTIEFWKKAFLENLSALNYSQNTISSYSSRLDKFMEFCLEREDELSIKDLKQAVFLSFFGWLDKNVVFFNKRSKISEKSAKNSTKLHYMTILRVFFKFISKNNDDLMDFDYLFDGFRIKDKNSNKKNIKHLNSGEVVKLLSFLEKKREKNCSYISNRNSLLIKLQLYAGLRVSEALNLFGIDFIENDGFYKIIIHQAKGGLEQVAFIRSNLIENELKYLVEIVGHNSFLFITRAGNQLSREQAYILITRVFKNCGIKQSGCHVLRHTFAMMMLSHNTNLSIIQKAMRHSHIKSTVIYADATDDMIKENLPK